MVGVGDEEYVLRALAHRRDLGVLQGDALLVEDLGYLEQQARTVTGDELDYRPRVQRVTGDRDLYGRGEHPHLARCAPCDLERLPAAARECFEQAVADLVEASPVGDGAAVALEQPIRVQ